MKDKIIETWYNIAYPKQEHRAVYPFRFEFLFEKTKYNLEHLWYFLIVNQIIETILYFVLNISDRMRLTIILFLIINLIQLLCLFRIKHIYFGVKYKTLLMLQTSILLNILFITSTFNIFEGKDIILVHLPILAYIFVAIVLHIPSFNLAIIGLLTLLYNLLGILYYHVNSSIVMLEVWNIVIFIIVSWWLGIIANRNRILLWMNLKTQKDINKTLEDISVRDSMTQFYNHEHIFRLLDQEIDYANDIKSDLSLAIFDLDDFKRINDNFGHQVGDLVLLEVAKTIKDCSRDSDLIGRYGGEEFMIIFPKLKAEQAFMVAQRIRQSIEQLNFDSFKITISGGVVELNQNSSIELIKEADLKLFKAKNLGKNRIIY